MEGVILRKYVEVGTVASAYDSEARQPTSDVEYVNESLDELFPYFPPPENDETMDIVGTLTEFHAWIGRDDSEPVYTRRSRVIVEQEFEDFCGGLRLLRDIVF